MPSHLIHFYVDRLFFGKVYYRIHRQMDSAYQYFGGAHRVFWHDPISAYAIAANEYPGDRNAISSALLHIQIDQECSADPVFHRQLNFLAEEDAQKRKHNKKRKKKTARTKKPKPLSELEKTEKVISQLLELKKLTDLIKS